MLLPASEQGYSRAPEPAGAQLKVGLWASDVQATRPAACCDLSGRCCVTAGPVQNAGSRWWAMASERLTSRAAVGRPLPRRQPTQRQESTIQRPRRGERTPRRPAASSSAARWGWLPAASRRARARPAGYATTAARTVRAWLLPGLIGEAWPPYCEHPARRLGWRRRPRQLPGLASQLPARPISASQEAISCFPRLPE